jgi:hypothetical protein
MSRESHPGTLKPSRAWLSSFAGTLTLAMSASTFLAFALGVLAPFITAELNLSRASMAATAIAMLRHVRGPRSDREQVPPAAPRKAGSR